MMPGVDGRTLAQAARRRAGPRFPILYATSLSSEVARDGVADGYVGKPFDPAYLLSVVRRVIT